MKVVLLGPNGQLGSDIRRAHEKFGEGIELLSIPRSRLDIGNGCAVAGVLDSLDFDILVNCTGYHKTDEVEDNANLAFAVNAHAVQLLALQCAKKQARLIHISTDYVFGGDEKRRLPIAEEETPLPVNVYGASKALGETLARSAHDNVVVLRVASLFGVAGSSSKAGNFVETIIRKCRLGIPLRVVDDQLMSPTSTADVACMILRMMVDSCEPDVYHVVNSGCASWFMFAKEIVRLTGGSAEVIPCSSDEYRTRARRPRYSVLENRKASCAFGPLASWQDALGRYCQERVQHSIGR